MPEERQALPNAHLERSGGRLRTLPGTARAFAAAAGCHCPLAGVLLVPCSRSLRPRLLPVPRSFLNTVDGVILLKENVPPSRLRSKIISLRVMVSHLVTMEAQTRSELRGPTRAPPLPPGPPSCPAPHHAAPWAPRSASATPGPLIPVPLYVCPPPGAPLPTSPNNAGTPLPVSAQAASSQFGPLWPLYR